MFYRAAVIAINTQLMFKTLQNDLIGFLTIFLSEITTLNVFES